MRDLLPPISGLPHYSDDQVIVRLQPFTAGGFEGTCYYRSRDSYRPQWQGGGCREEGQEAASEDRLERARRAKQTVRRKAREMGVDRLVTFTTREQSNDAVGLLDRVAAFVKEYNRAMHSSGKAPLRYVAVPEPHPTNPSHWHVHLATVGYFHLQVANVIWWRACGGRGMGNIDVRKLRAWSPIARTARIAKYISKYITKGFDGGLELGGHRRFRASVGALQGKRVFVLASSHLGLALDELLRVLGLVRGDLCVRYFPDGGGFWFSAAGDFAIVAPPF